MSPSSSGDPLAFEVATALRTPLVPEFVTALEAVPGFLEFAWSQLAPSVDTAGFLGSALYMVDIARRRRGGL